MDTRICTISLVFLSALGAQAHFFNKTQNGDRCCEYRYQYAALEKCCAGQYDSHCCRPLKAVEADSWKDCIPGLHGDCEVVTYRLNDKILHRTVKKLYPTKGYISHAAGDDEYYGLNKNGQTNMSNNWREWYRQHGADPDAMLVRQPPRNHYMPAGHSWHHTKNGHFQDHYRSPHGRNGSHGGHSFDGRDAGSGGHGGHAAKNHLNQFIGKGGDGGDGGHAYAGGVAGDGGAGGDGTHGGDGGDGGDTFFSGKAGNGGPGGDGGQGGEGGDGGNAYFGGEAGHGGPGGDGGDAIYGGKAGNGGPGGDGGDAWYGGEAGDGGPGGNGGNAYYFGTPGKGGDGGVGGKFYPNGPDFPHEIQKSPMSNLNHFVWAGISG